MKQTLNNAKIPESCLASVRCSALEWWETLPNKIKKEITDTNKDILMKGIPRTWQRLTGREIEKLFRIQHYA